MVQAKLGDLRQSTTDGREVGRKRAEVITARAPGHRPPAGQAVPGEVSVQLRFVSELERLDRAAADAVEQRAGLRGRERRIVGLEIDAENQPGA